MSTFALAFNAALVDSRPADSSTWATAFDVAVGLGFITTAALSPAVALERLMMGAVGVTWLLASSSPELHWLHQGLLAVALVAFPSGRPRNLFGWLVAALGVAVLFGLASQIGVALVFAAVATSSFVGTMSKPVRWYCSGSATGLALILWAIANNDTFDPRGQTTAYELVLLVVAVGFYATSRYLIGERERFADRLIGDAPPSGLDGLETILRNTLGDSRLRIYQWSAAGDAYIDTRGQRLPEQPANQAILTVDDGPDRIAAVVHQQAALDDAAVRRAVASAVRLTADNVRLREELDKQLVELEAARTRLVAAADRQRSATASRLREEVLSPLQQAMSVLSPPRSASRDEIAGAVDTIDIAVREIATARDEVLTVVSGVPSATLGDGRLPQAIESLAQHCPIPVTVTTAPGVTAPVEVETALFYVCSEALTNAAKHAEAQHIEVGVDATDDTITLAVHDDGRGGADQSGSGIMGLADRLAARGGRLRVDSPPGAGTTITAEVPR